MIAMKIVKCHEFLQEMSPSTITHQYDWTRDGHLMEDGEMRSVRRWLSRPWFHLFMSAAPFETIEVLRELQSFCVGSSPGYEQFGRQFYETFYARFVEYR